MNKHLKDLIFNAILMSIIIVACIFAMVVNLRYWLIGVFGCIVIAPILWKSIEDLNKWLKGVED